MMMMKKNNAKQQEQQREKDEHKSYAHYLKAVREGNVHAFDDLDDDDDDQKLESFLEKSLANASSLKKTRMTTTKRMRGVLYTSRPQTDTETS